MKRPLFLLLLVVPGFGFTDCQYFKKVPVATNETTPPIVGARVWVDGVERFLLGDGAWAASSGGDVVVYPFVYDDGGARSIYLQQQVQIRCHNDDIEPEETQVTNIYYFDKSEAQAAATAGQLRSNGIYLGGDVTNLWDHEWYCYDGYQLETVTYYWWVTGRDYSGNQTVAFQSVVYTP